MNNLKRKPHQAQLVFMKVHVFFALPRHTSFGNAPSYASWSLNQVKLE